jgi:hypothetical protein
MPETKTYSGGCHCGSVRFEVTTDLSQVAQCNCSICSRAGWLLGRANGDTFKLLSGEELLTDYQFGKKRIHHVFCRTCGVRSFSRAAGPDGKEVFAFNVRCLEGVDLAGLTIKPVDGKSF